MATLLYRLITDRDLALPDDPELLEELANLRLKETSSGTLRFDHDSGRHDDRAVALALAATHLTERPPPGRAVIVAGPSGPLGTYDRPPEPVDWSTVQL
jgi:hypothetical protein